MIKLNFVNVYMFYLGNVTYHAKKALRALLAWRAHKAHGIVTIGYYAH